LYPSSVRVGLFPPLLSGVVADEVEEFCSLHKVQLMNQVQE